MSISHRLPSILFIHNLPSKFVRTDLALLREQYTVSEWYQRGRIVNLAVLSRAIAASDLVFGWFASWHTFFPVLIARVLKRPSILVVGGYDTANLPEAGYGSQRGGLKRLVARATIRSASRLITNSSFTRDEAVRNANADPDRITVIYHGLEMPVSASNGKRDNLVMTAGNVDMPNLHRKGLEPFVRAAACLPNLEFALVGAWRDQAITHLRSIASPNVLFTGWVNDQELERYFSSASVYIQASLHEGFGLAVAEAMGHGCIPVVMRAGALPEVVGDAGIYVDSTNPAAVAEGVRQALARDASFGQAARSRIAREFPLERRRELLIAQIDKMLDGRLEVFPTIRQRPSESSLASGG